MTSADTGNRQGLARGNACRNMPARMVGSYLCSEQRKPGTEAGGVLNRTVDEGQGRPSSTLFAFALIAFFFGAITPANAAGRGLTPLSAVSARSTAERPPTADELAAARGVEGLLIDLMIQEMRKSVPENEVVPLSQGERIFRQMLDSEYGRIMSESGTLGVADLVLAQIKGRR